METVDTVDNITPEMIEAGRSAYLDAVFGDLPSGDAVRGIWEAMWRAAKTSNRLPLLLNVVSLRVVGQVPLSPLPEYDPPVEKHHPSE